MKYENTKSVISFVQMNRALKQINMFT